MHEEDSALAFNPFREAGLPLMTPDTGGEHGRYGIYKGIVRAVYEDVRRVDIEPEQGGLLRQAIVQGEVLPEVHIDTERPSHVLFAHINGNIHDVVCWPIDWRRAFGPETTDDGHERHYYHKNQEIRRVKDITVRITPDNRIYIWDAESEDYAVYDMNERTFHVIAPHVFIGTDKETRIQYDRAEHIKMVIPKCLIGATAVEDEDGVTYLQHQLIHLVSDLIVKATAGAEIELIAPLIKLSAESIILDPVNIKLGHAGATERLVLGDLFRAFLNVFFTAYSGHTHSNVQTGAGVSGPPVVPATLMDDSMLSDIAHVSKTGI
jgi:hypothetical protein